MGTSDYDKLTAEFIGFIIKNIPTDLRVTTMEGWIRNPPEAIRKFFSGLNTPIVSVAKTTQLAKVNNKPTKKCFVGKRWFHDIYFNSHLPTNQKRADACVVSTLAFSWDWKFAEATAVILGIGACTDIVFLGKLLKKSGHIMTLTQAEKIVVENIKKSSKMKKADNTHNAFFVENKDGGVSVGVVYRKWNSLVYGDYDDHASLRDFDDDHRWNANNTRLLVPNLDTSKF